MRARSFVGVGCLGFALGACAVVFDFDGYVTRPSRVREAGAPETAGFTLVVEEATLVAGTPASLAVAVKRDPGFDAAITVDVLGAPPLGLTVGGPITIAELASQGTLPVASEAATTPGRATLQLVATGGSVRRTHEATLVVRGRPCSLDRSFGSAGVTPIPDVPEPRNRLTATLSGDELTVTTYEERTKVSRIDASGGVRWTRTLSTTTAALAAAAPDGFVYLAGGSALRRLDPAGADDTAYGVRLAHCEPIRALHFVPEVLAVCAAPSNGWTLTSFPGGANLATAVVMGPGIVATQPEAITGVGPILTCGQAMYPTTSRGALARWKATPFDLDATWAVGGRRLLGADTLTIACASDERNTFALGGEGGAVVLFGFGPRGEIFDEFGDAGVRPIDSVADPAVDRGAILLDDDRLLVLVGTVDGAYLYRFLRNGQIDPTFGTEGRCDLSSTTLVHAVTALHARDHKLLVVSQDPSSGATLVGRVWL